LAAVGEVRLIVVRDQVEPARQKVNNDREERIGLSASAPRVGYRKAKSDRQPPLYGNPVLIKSAETHKYIRDPTVL
jgi:hypothetical protein